jgi:23S rRNA (cytosine1962-C5)-methyltransferase
MSSIFTAQAPVRLKKGADEAIIRGMPWVYAGDIIDSSELLHIAAGSLVSVENHKGQRLATGYYNRASQIACRILTASHEAIDEAFFARRLQQALARRAPLGVPCYRLVHSEGDGLPGLLLDRFGDLLVAQVGTAGMEALRPLWIQALKGILDPKALLLRNDAAARKREGLSQYVRWEWGAAGERVEVQENGCIYYADLEHGQKTGWFFDQRDNRALIAGLAGGKTLVDVYSHSGGFGVLAALHGASEVTMVDSSALALELAMQAAGRNGVQARCRTVQGDAFERMQQMAAQGQAFDMVLADPPAFVKARKDIATGLKGYEKVARLAAPLARDGGMLFVASCSHHAGRSAFNKAVLEGVAKAGFAAEILRQTGAGIDHPRHACLQQNEYLKGILLALRPG